MPTQYEELKTDERTYGNGRFVAVAAMAVTDDSGTNFYYTVAKGKVLSGGGRKTDHRVWIPADPRDPRDLGAIVADALRQMSTDWREAYLSDARARAFVDAAFEDAPRKAA